MGGFEFNYMRKMYRVLLIVSPFHVDLSLISVLERGGGALTQVKKNGRVVEDCRL